MSPNWTNDDGSCAPCHDEARGGSPCFIHGAKPPTKRRRAAKSASPSLDELDALHAAAFPGVWCTGTRGECATVYVTSVPPMRAVVTFAEVSNDDNAHAMAALHNAWPAISARLRAAEAEVEVEVERLRGALRGAIEELDTIPEDPKRFARVAGMTIPLVRGGLAKALLPAKARAALGEP